MDNNAVLKKIMIAQNIKQFDCKDVFELGGLPVSSSQIKAFTAGTSNKNFVALSDEQLEQFFTGLIIHNRGEKDDPTVIPRAIESYVLGLMKAGLSDTLEELSCLIEDARDGIEQGCSIDEDEEVIESLKE